MRFIAFTFILFLFASPLIGQNGDFPYEQWIASLAFNKDPRTEKNSLPSPDTDETEVGRIQIQLAVVVCSSATLTNHLTNNHRNTKS